MAPTVSTVIATVGRSSLRRAVCSVLEQTYRVEEIIVVANADVNLDLPDDSRITVLDNVFHADPASARQFGIDAARGSVIAVLDDDDEWYPNKLELQLNAVAARTSDCWIVSSRMEVRGPGARRRIWPRRLIEPGESVAEYLFRFTGVRVGGAVLQSSTLCFPAALARRVRWDSHEGSIQDEPSWLIDVQRSFPDVNVVQLPDALSVYDVTAPSVSRQSRDLTDSYIAWGLHYLRGESPRVRGDYLCTRPVSAAVSAGSLGGVWRSVRSALRHGRPGMSAMNYAALNAARIIPAATLARFRRHAQSNGDP